MPHYSTILFDLDGVLTDPWKGITRSIRYALRAMGRTAPPGCALLDCIGPPLLHSFEHRFGMSPEAARQAAEHYREYFCRRGMFENRVFPGIPELLEELRRAGRRLLVATAKPRVYAERILEHFSLRPWFAEVAGAELDHTRIYKREVIAHALTLLTAEQRAGAVMIGDRRDDILGAREHALASIGVGWGYGSREELEAAGPTHLAADLPALRSLLLPPGD